MPLSVHFLYPVPIEDGTKSGFTAILVALQIEFDIFNFYLAVDHISSVAQIHSLLTPVTCCIFSFKYGIDSKGIF